MGRTGLAFHGLHEGASAVLFGTPRQTTNFLASFHPLLPISANSAPQEQGIAAAAQPAPRGQSTALIQFDDIWKELEKMKKMSPI
jgi:hypothetical protein